MVLGLSRQQRGTVGERRAEALLRRARLEILERNYRCRGGELDLVAHTRGGELVMVEARCRGRGAQGGAVASVDAHKRQRMIWATRHWLSTHPDYSEAPLRFDVIAIDGDVRRAPLQWIRNAFDA